MLGGKRVESPSFRPLRRIDNLRTSYLELTPHALCLYLLRMFSALLAFPFFYRPLTFSLTPLFPLIGLARIASRDCSIPCGMMRPRPILGHSAIGHRAKRSRHRCCAFVDVNDKTSQH